VRPQTENEGDITPFAGEKSSSQRKITRNIMRIDNQLHYQVNIKVGVTESGFKSLFLEVPSRKRVMAVLLRSISKPLILTIAKCWKIWRQRVFRCSIWMARR